MKKIALALSLVGTFSFIQAESDGAFIGVGLGFGQNKVTYDVPLAISSVSQKKNQINYIGVVGYKKFFNENFGLRTYLSYEQSNNKGYGFVVEYPADDPYVLIGNIKTRTIMLNIDMLYNFSNSSDLTYGVFAGIGFGATKFIASADGDKFSKNQFDPILNLGFRALALQHHGLEIRMKALFRKARIDTYDPDDGAGIVEIKRKPRFDFIYTYSF